MDQTNLEMLEDGILIIEKRRFIYSVHMSTYYSMFLFFIHAICENENLSTKTIVAE